MQNFVKINCFHQSHIAGKAMKAFLGLILTALFFYPGTQQVMAKGSQAPPAPMPINALIELDSETPAEMEAIIALMESDGANVPLSFAPRMLFVQIPEGLDTSSWNSEAGVVAIYRGNAEITSNDPHDQLAEMVWNSWLVDHPFACCENPGVQSSQREESHSAHLHFHPEGPEGTLNAFLSRSQPESAQQNRTADFSLTSSYYLGDYQVDLFIAESVGNAENWDEARRDEVVIGVASGILWWVGTSQKRFARPLNLSYNLTIHDPFITPDDVKTQYEPIQTASHTGNAFEADAPPTAPYREHDWVGELMSNVKQEGSPDLGAPSHYVAMWDFINLRRKEMKRDFGFIVFMVDSQNDEDGFFAPNSSGFDSFAYAGRPGPHIVMTYDNGNNARQIGAINGIKINMAHEMGHTIGSAEEYSGGCSPTEKTGYFWVENVNCEDGGSTTEDSIMRSPDNQRATFPQLSLSSPIREMAGWRNSDGDELMDPLDTTPMLVMAGIQLLNPDENIYVYKGRAIDVPFHVPAARLENRFRQPKNINTIAMVEYRVGEGDWVPCGPQDPADETGFDTSIEKFSCQVMNPDDGTEAVSFRAQNSVGAYSEVLSYPFTELLDNQPPSGTMALVSGSHTVSAPTVHLALSSIDDGGVSEYRIKYNGQWREWKSARTTKGYGVFKLSSTAPSHTLGVQYRDLNQLQTEPFFIPEIILDMEAPTGDLQVSVGTNEESGTLQFVMGMIASDDKNLSRMNLFYDDRWHGWEGYATERVITNLPYNVNHLFMAQYQDAAGNTSPVYTAVYEAPTPTPAPTDTPVPTGTPAPTNTPVPTDTAIPTDTPAPTETPTATDMPLPTTTSTAIPAATEIATEVPNETLTADPTADPFATPVVPQETSVPATSVPTTENPVGDADGDGVLNSVECAEDIEDLDMDEDGLDNCEDIDSDGDGLTDYLESQPLPVLIFIASQNAGPLDTDRDGNPDYLDTDSDGDGLSDTEEAFAISVEPIGIDTNGDGLDDAYHEYFEEVIDDGTCAEFPDADGDNVPDFRDRIENAGVSDPVCLQVDTPAGTVFEVDTKMMFLPFISR